MVAIDVDGTLLRSDKRLSRRNIEAIARAVEQGVRIVLATARPPRSMRELYDILQPDPLQINYNGALIFDRASRANLYHRPLSLDMTRQVVEFARQLDPEVIVSLEVLDKWYTDRVHLSLHTETSRSFGPDMVAPLEEILRTAVTKLMLLAPPAQLVPVHAQIRAAFGSDLAIAVSDEHLIQITHPSVDKGNALALLAEHYGLAREQVMAIGDAPNDQGMLRWAGLGVAMDNAWPSLRDAADVVVPSNDQDGVAAALERFVLK
ncbi:MAG: Cof-type HAD-IIB family hydrolase [Phycisphaeraceae bacterium]